jgi:hypothetical protein
MNNNINNESKTKSSNLELAISVMWCNNHRIDDEHDPKAWDDIGSILYNINAASNVVYLQLPNKSAIQPYKAKSIKRPVNSGSEDYSLFSGAEWKITRPDSKKRTWLMINISTGKEESIRGEKGAWKWIKNKLINEHCYIVFNHELTIDYYMRNDCSLDPEYYAKHFIRQALIAQTYRGSLRPVMLEQLSKETEDKYHNNNNNNNNNYNNNNNNNNNIECDIELY